MLDSLMLKGYKGFSKVHLVGFSEFKKINLIIGKNNIGKSSLLQAVQSVESKDSFRSFLRVTDDVELNVIPDRENIDRFFPKNLSGGDVGGNFNTFGVSYINTPISVSLNTRNLVRNGLPHTKNLSFQNVDIKQIKVNTNNGLIQPTRGLDEFKRMAANLIDQQLGNNINRLAADRDLRPERGTKEPSIMPDGTGATNMIQAYLNDAKLSSDKVRKDLLDGLNEIMTGEEVFKNIFIQNISDDNTPMWEVFLEEDEKGMIPLSASGSGLRTILLVLVELILAKSADIYIFEELENNLHPAIQRNLFQYIFKWAKTSHRTVFITTHSSVPIDMVVSDEEAQIIHVYKDGKDVVTKQAISFSDDNYILDDLDIRGSDLLQSNGIIWVEGPSDRIYLNKWLSLISNEKLIENKHYQIMFYGGRLLSHLQADQRDNDLISLLLANRNSAILIDSDKTYRSKKINTTKNRIKNEFENEGMICWITKGKEIENYLSQRILNDHFANGKKVLPQIDQYQKIGDYLDELNQKKQTAYKSKCYNEHKVDEAHSIAKLYNLDDLDVLDLKVQLRALYKEINRWNHIEK